MSSILVLDDRPDNLATIEAILSGVHTVITETDPTNLFARLSEYEPDLLVLDLRLPGIDGLDLARSIRQHISSAMLPIIAVTAAPENYYRDDVFNSGCDVYLPKPFGVKDFRNEVNRLITR